MNKKAYMDNYCREFQIPELNVLDAEINHYNINYIFQLVKYIFPKDGSKKGKGASMDSEKNND